MAVPNTNTFSLSDVITEIGGGVDSLADCFSNSNSLGFDPAYSGGKNSLLNFRNYSDTPDMQNVVLSKSNSSFADSCLFGNSAIYYVNEGTFEDSTMLFTNISGTTNAGMGWYSDGLRSRYWNGNAYEGSIFIC